MLQPVGGRITRAKRSNVVPLPIPYQGWNTRDQLAEIQPVFAPRIDNFLPTDGALVLRKGYTEHASGVTGGVETLAYYDDGSTSKMWAFGNDAIYDVTSSGAVGTAAVSSLSNDRWDWTLFSTLGGVFLVACNAADGVRTYDGSSWATQTITGATASTLRGVVAHKNRLWMIEDGTLDAWYMDSVNAIAGGMTKLPLGALCQRGGELAALATWTRDGGSGLDDFFVAITTNGEVLVYSGTDPSTTSWYLVGRFVISPPLGKSRSVTRVGGDLWILTRAGVYSLMDIVSGNTAQPMVSQVIEPSFRAAASDAGTSFGWQIMRYTPKNWVVCNIPQPTLNTFDQYVFGRRDQAWSRFIDMNGTCWLEYDNKIWFGASDGKVYRADNGEDDDGDPIAADVVFSHNKFGSGIIKRFTACRLHYRGRGEIKPAVTMLTEYDLAGPQLSADLSIASGGAVWGSAVWDEAQWQDPTDAATQRLGLRAIGAVGSLRVKISAQDTALTITGAEVAFEVGQTI